MKRPIEPAARASEGGGSPRRYFPVRTPCASGDHTTWPIPSRSQSGKTVALGLAPERGVLRLAGDEARDARQRERLLDPLYRPLAEADEARLAGLHHLGQRAHRLLQRRPSS